MVRNIIENQNEKAIETMGRMDDKSDPNEFKDKFKERYQSDWDTIIDTCKDDPAQDGLPAEEHFLEELYEYNRRQIQD